MVVRLSDMLKRFFCTILFAFLSRCIRFEGKSYFSDTFNIKDFFLENESTLVCHARQILLVLVADFGT
jgi:hypothetical protein